MSDDLLKDIQSSIMEMQTQMQSTYADLSSIKVVGESHDKTVKITMTATYGFEDIEFDEKALQGGLKEFRWRVREAWNDLSKAIQKTTQDQTMKLLEGMDIPDEIRNLDAQEEGK